MTDETSYTANPPRWERVTIEPSDDTAGVLYTDDGSLTYGPATDEDGYETDHDISDPSDLADIYAVLSDMGAEIHGCELIRDDGDEDMTFTDYTEELIADCYPWPPSEQSGRYGVPAQAVDTNAWPWRHLTLDYAAAADELRADYTSVTLFGTDYLAQ